jgi:hypothetical protein
VAQRKIVTFPKKIATKCKSCGCLLEVNDTSQICYESVPLHGFGTYTPFYVICSECGQYTELCDGTGRVSIRGVEADPIRRFLMQYHKQDLFLEMRNFWGHNRVQGKRITAQFRPGLDVKCQNCGTRFGITVSTDIHYRIETCGEEGTLYVFVAKCPTCRRDTNVVGYSNTLEPMRQHGYFKWGR